MLRSERLVGLAGTGEPRVALFGEFGGKDAREEARERLCGFGGGTGLSEATLERPEATEDLLLALELIVKEVSVSNTRYSRAYKLLTP